MKVVKVIAVSRENGRHPAGRIGLLSMDRVDLMATYSASI
jgi:hypothetical protein